MIFWLRFARFACANAAITVLHRDIVGNVAVRNIVRLLRLFRAVCVRIWDCRSSVTLHYLFAVCNSLGGLWIFGFHLLMDPEVKTKARHSHFGALLGPRYGKRKGLVVRRRKGGTLEHALSLDDHTSTGGTSKTMSKDGTLEPPASPPTAEISLESQLSASSPLQDMILESRLTASSSLQDIILEPSDIPGGHGAAASPGVRRGSSCRPVPGLLQPPTGPAFEAVVNPVMDAGLSKPHEGYPSAERRTSCAGEGELLATTELPVYVHPPASARSSGDAADPEGQPIDRLATVTTMWDPDSDDAADPEGQPIDRLATVTTMWDPEPDEQRSRERAATLWERGEKRGSADGGTPTAAPSED